MLTNFRWIKLLLLLAIPAIAAGLIIMAAEINHITADGPLKEKMAAVYRSAGCGCCANYIAYLKRAGVRVEEKLTEDMAAVRKKFSVSDELSSCHTTQIENYTIEGHIPIEAIEKLLAEKPNLAGIALPLMPAGSPGMPGRKVETFNISGFTAAGSSSPYLSL